MFSAIRAVAPVLAFATITFAASPALADPLDYNALGQACYYSGGNQCVTTTDFVTVTSPVGNSATLNRTPQPSISLTAPGGGTYSPTSGSIRYSWQLYVLAQLGAVAGTDIDDAGLFSGTYDVLPALGLATVSAETGINYTGPNPTDPLSGGTLRYWNHSTAGTGTYQITGAGTLVATGVDVGGTLYDVIQGNIRIKATLNGYGAGHAMIDPTLSGNAAGLQAAGYSANGSFVALPSGFGNGPMGAAPEPAQWTLLIGGFGLAGFAARRRRAVYA